ALHLGTGGHQAHVDTATSGRGLDVAEGGRGPQTQEQGGAQIDHDRVRRRADGVVERSAELRLDERVELAFDTDHHAAVVAVQRAHAGAAGAGLVVGAAGVMEPAGERDFDCHGWNLPGSGPDRYGWVIDTAGSSDGWSHSSA